MKKTSLLCCIFVFVLVSCGFAAVNKVDPSKEPKDFRGIKWGQDISIMKNMVLIEKANGTEVFRQKGENLRIGPLKLDDLVYYSDNKKFCGVAMFLKGKDASQLFNEAIALHGQSSLGETKDNITTHIWKFPLVDVVYRFDASKQEADLNYLYRKFTPK